MARTKMTLSALKAITGGNISKLVVLYSTPETPERRYEIDTSTHTGATVLPLEVNDLPRVTVIGNDDEVTIDDTDN